MTEEQLEVLNITQEVLRGLTTTLLALNPEALPRIASGLGAFAGAPGLSPIARSMLQDLAAGVALIERAGKRAS